MAAKDELLVAQDAWDADAPGVTVSLPGVLWLRLGGSGSVVVGMTLDVLREIRDGLAGVDYNLGPGAETFFQAAEKVLR